MRKNSPPFALASRLVAFFAKVPCHLEALPEKYGPVVSATHEEQPARRVAVGTAPAAGAVFRALAEN